MQQHLCWPQRNFPLHPRDLQVWCCWPCSSDLGHVARADSPPWLTSLSPVRHISLVARENMVTGFFPSTCLMIGSCPTRPSSWTRFMAETRETKHTYRWTSNHGKPLISSFCQGPGSQLPASPNHFSTSCDFWLFQAPADGWLCLYCHYYYYDITYLKSQRFFILSVLSFAQTHPYITWD